MTETPTCDLLLHAGRQGALGADMPSMTMGHRGPSQNGIKSKQFGISGWATWIMGLSPQQRPAAWPHSHWDWYMCKDHVARRRTPGTDRVKEWVNGNHQMPSAWPKPPGGCQSRSDHSCGLTQYKNTHTWPWHETAWAGPLFMTDTTGKFMEAPDGNVWIGSYKNSRTVGRRLND